MPAPPWIGSSTSSPTGSGSRSTTHRVLSWRVPAQDFEICNAVRAAGALPGEALPIWKGLLRGEPALDLDGGIQVRPELGAKAEKLRAKARIANARQEGVIEAVESTLKRR